MTHLRVMEFGHFISSSDDFDVPAPWQAIGSIARRLLAEIAAPRFEGVRMVAADGPTDVRRQSAGKGWARPSEMGSAPAGGMECRAPGLGGCWEPRRARRPWEVDPADEGEG